ncbi:MYCBP-associated protein [Geodia barretti]|uniref:MYCBP-associated protein n=1 Tax=Geodia barretti TaxID=519541 RepID=A0AA35XBE0_GEOBA|nr:MYCBP-associated protein [Geodia barretti]
MTPVWTHWGKKRPTAEDSLSGNEDFAHPSNRMVSQDVVPEMFPQSLEGPALNIRDHLLKWEKSHVQTSQTRSEPVEFRLMFESGVEEEEVTSCLPMENCGTTAIYYSWKRFVQPNPLQTVQAGDVQRFYFDTRGGVLLPGQVQSFPFVFKSTNAGIFTEVWALQTCPLLAGGQTIRITLRGVAFQEDTNKHKREDLERELSHRVAVVAAERLVKQIVNSIATPPHSSPQLLDTLPEEDVFRSQNPHLYYHYNVVLQLKALYDEILRPELTEDENPPPSVDSGPSKKEKGKQAPAGGGGGKKEKEKERGESSGQDKKGKTVKTEPSEKVEIPESPKPVEKPVPDWDLSTHTLLEVVLGIEEDQRREEKLKLLSDLLGELSFPPPSLPRTSSYSLVYVYIEIFSGEKSFSGIRM